MKRILVVGELNVDLIMSGLPSLPVLGKELLCQDFQLVLGGSSSICACWMAGVGAGLDARVDLWGKVGSDPYSDFLIEALQAQGVGTQGVIRDPTIRTGATISLTYPHDRAMMTFLGAIAELQLSDIDLDQLSSYDHLHSASIFLQHRLRPDLAALFEAAQNAGLTTSLDSGWDPDDEWQGVLDILSHVDFFLPNETEAIHLSGERTVEQAARALSRTAKTVVVKLGAEGALAHSGEQTWRVPGFAVAPVDTTGAGDSFNAGFVCAHVVQGRSIPDAMRFANACGAIAVTTIGGTTGIPPVSQVDAFIARKKTS
ncbi:MAG: carbohydrate kinase family protein [Anaerolineae bacterium]|nr:carbohydrate kinase family protein [Anaerolineae bacterium]